MSEEGGAASATAVPPVPAPKRGTSTVLSLLVAFAIGVALTVGAMLYFQGRWNDSPRQPVTTAEPNLRAGTAVRPLSNDAAQMLDGRVVQLEERLNRITVEAQAASGNAARAESLLVAFAARRALDSGNPLGYVEGQLRLRFGQAQPRAVATIINAAREPVTLADLRAGLTGVADQLTTPGPQISWWEALDHEARALLTIRRSSTASPRPEAAMERALRYIDAGRVSAALTEVADMPGKAAADRWMQYARRYIEARRALDLIETAAILEPRELHGGDGAPVAPTSPLAP